MKITDLLERYQQTRSGDDLAALMDGLRKPVISFIRWRCVKQMDVDDVLQQVWLKIIRHIGSYKPDAEGGLEWVKELVKDVVDDYGRYWNRQRRGGRYETVHYPCDTLTDQRQNEAEASAIRS